MIKQFGWAYFQPIDRDQDQSDKYGIIKRIGFNLRGFGGLQLQPTPKKDDDPVDAGRGIFFNHIDNSEIDYSGFNEDYPSGNMIEHYDIEREQEMCLNQNTCFTRADA